MAKRKKKSYRRFGRKAKKQISKARRKTFRIIKAIALEGPLLAYCYQGTIGTPGLGGKLMVVAKRLCLGTTGVSYSSGSQTVSFEPQYLLLGWGGPLAYKGVQFGMNLIPGKKDSPFAELAALTG